MITTPGLFVGSTPHEQMKRFFGISSLCPALQIACWSECRLNTKGACIGGKDGSHCQKALQTVSVGVPGAVDGRPAAPQLQIPVFS